MIWGTPISELLNLWWIQLQCSCSYFCWFLRTIPQLSQYIYHKALQFSLLRGTITVAWLYVSPGSITGETWRDCPLATKGAAISSWVSWLIHKSCVFLVSLDACWRWYFFGKTHKGAKIVLIYFFWGDPQYWAQRQPLHRWLFEICHRWLLPNVSIVVDSNSTKPGYTVVPQNMQ